MTHDQIQQAARERMAEIDRQIETLRAERAKLASMVAGYAPSPPLMPNIMPIAVPFPVYPAPPYRPPWLTDITITGTSFDSTGYASPMGLHTHA